MHRFSLAQFGVGLFGSFGRSVIVPCGVFRGSFGTRLPFLLHPWPVVGALAVVAKKTLSIGVSTTRWTRARGVRGLSSWRGGPKKSTRPRRKAGRSVARCIQFNLRLAVFGSGEGSRLHVMCHHRGQKGHSVCPWFMKKRWYDISATQVSIDVRGIWPSDVKTRAASPPGILNLT